MKLLLIIPAIVVAGLLCAYIYNSALTVVAHKNTDERVIFVTGSYTEPKYLDAWQQYLESQLPNKEIQVFRAYYPYKPIPESTPRLLEVRNQLVELLLDKSDKPTRVITYSYGAVIFSAALNEIENNSASVNIIKTVTVAGPIADDSAFGDKEFRESRVQIGYDFNNQLPNHASVCGYFDSLVSCKRATYPNDSSINTISNHYTYVVPQLFSGRTILKALYN